MTGDAVPVGHILVVDDNEMNRDMLSRRLRRMDCSVDVAGDGEQALEMMQATTYDLVMLDLMMPRMNGYEVLEYIKGDEKLRDIPIIMISAVDDLDSVVKCIEMGADDYLFKPFNPVILRARVGASVERRRSHKVSPNTDLRTTVQSLTDDLQRLTSGDVGVLNEQQHAITERMATQLRQLNTLLNR